MKIYVAVLCVVALGGSAAFAQKAQTAPKNRSKAKSQQILLLPVDKISLRPTLDLTGALKIAESFIAAEKIDMTDRFLFGAKLMIYGEAARARPAWLLWWARENGAVGDYLEILIPTDSKTAMRLPSM